MTITVEDLLETMNTLAPQQNALDWDNCGLLVGNKNQPLCKVLVALDATPQVVQEAIAIGAQAIVSHHPVIFGRGRQRFLCGDPAFEAAAAGIALIAAHTNYDMASHGVNDALAQSLGLTDVIPLCKERSRPYKKIVVFVPDTHADLVYHAMGEAGAGQVGNYAKAAALVDVEGRFLPLEGAQPFVGQVGDICCVQERKIEMLVHPDTLPAVLQAMQQAHPYQEPAYDIYDDYGLTHDCWIGCIGDLPKVMDEMAFGRYIHQTLGIAPRFNPGPRQIARVAICGGAGADYLSQVDHIDAFVTGDVKHHQFVEASMRNITLYDAGHYATEQPAMPQLCNQLRRLLPSLTIQLAQSYAGEVISV